MQNLGRPSLANNRSTSWWNSLPERSKLGIILLGFLGFFLLLLLPIAHSGSIFGTVDTLFGPALSNTFLDRIRTLVSGQFTGQSMYPADIARYGETGIGSASIFMLFRALGASDVFALYFTQAFLLAMMAFACVLLARQYTESLSSAVFVAFIFSTSNYVWADIDHLPIHFYFFPLLGAYFIKRAISEDNARLMLAAGFMGGLQMYFSVQVYIYQTLILAVILLFSIRNLWKASSWRGIGLFAGTYLLIPIPLFLFYLNTVLNLGVVDVFSLSQWEEVYSFQLSDFLRTLPGKLITYPFINPSAGGWPRVAHSAFVGLATPLLAILAIPRLNKQKLELILIGILGLVFALGRTITVGETVIESPLILFYKYIPLAKYLRVELRSYTIALLSLSILAGLGWEKISHHLGRLNRKLPSIGLVLITLFISAENISWPLNSYEIMKYPAIPGGYAQFFKDKPNALISGFAFKQHAMARLHR